MLALRGSTCRISTLHLGLPFRLHDIIFVHMYWKHPPPSSSPLTPFYILFPRFLNVASRADLGS
ncbi:hypothetical protein K438DRAFT_1861866 [Mycena galopus ATCC 62051]|nr:hypothetical protein K438DRAFT_1861866 [Mycena galopus ATCC 62051]